MKKNRKSFVRIAGEYNGIPGVHGNKKKNTPLIQKDRGRLCVLYCGCDSIVNRSDI